jgi:quercetin dioxygenase-like cupin family protein
MKLIHTSPEATPGPGDSFTGSVWIDQLIAAAEGPGRLQAANVHFAPGGRTVWHRHDGGQVIYVIEGVGRAQSRGGKIQEICPGDSIAFDPGEWHWHGSAPGKLMAHVAMQVVEEGHEPAEWGEPVTEEEYLAKP